MDIRAILMGLAFAFMWSSAFTSARIIVADAPPVTALAIRFLVSGLIAIAIARALGQTWKLSRNAWKATFIFGICQNALYLGLNFYAMQTVEASLASIIASTMPLIVAFLGWSVFKEKLPTLAVVGLFAGVVGVTIIMSARLSASEVDVIGIALCFVAALGLAVATLAVKGTSSSGNVMMIVGLQMLVGSAILAVVAVFTETWQVNWTWELAGAFVYTTLIPGLTATWVWFTLVNRIGAIRAATFHFLNPFFGVAVAWAVLGEQMQIQDLIGVGVVTVGILAVQLSKQS